MRHDESAAPGAKQPPFHPNYKKEDGWFGQRLNILLKYTENDSDSNVDPIDVLINDAVHFKPAV